LLKNNCWLDFKLIKSYVDGQCNASELLKIARKRHKNTIIEVIFNLMEMLIRTSGGEINIKNQKQSIIKYYEIDEYMAQLLCGSLSKENAKKFLYSITVSDVIFKKVLQKIMESDLNQLDQTSVSFAMRSDESIIEQIMGESSFKINNHNKKITEAISKHVIRMHNLLSSIRPSFRLNAVVIITIVITICGVWRFINYKKEGQISEFIVLRQTVPPKYSESGLRDISGMINNPKDIAFYQQFKISMTDYVNGKYEQAVVMFKKGQPDTIRIVQSLLMIKVVRDYYFYWGMSRLIGIHQKLPVSLDDQKRLLEVVELLNNALSVALRNKLNNIDREEFYLGLTLGLAGRKSMACEYLKKISSESKFHDNAIVLIALWQKKN
jgi:hypothetical protein